MYCPVCGTNLIEVKRDIPEVDWAADLTEEELEKQIELENKAREDQSEWYECEGECFGKTFPIVLHHPLKGLNSKPGDSWSLSWLK